MLEINVYSIIDSKVFGVTFGVSFLLGGEWVEYGLANTFGGSIGLYAINLDLV